MELSDGDNRLEINLLGNDGDARMSVYVSSMGFSGYADSHVLYVQLKRFCCELANLQRNLKGKAELKSLQSEVFSITIEPFGSRGHMSVVGKLGYQASTSLGENWHSVEFGFEFEPQQLDKAVKVPWVRSYLS